MTYEKACEYYGKEAVDRFCLEFIDLSIKAHEEEERIKREGLLKKLCHVYKKIVKPYFYYKWWCYYANPSEYNKYRMAEQVIKFKNKVEW